MEIKTDYFRHKIDGSIDLQLYYNFLRLGPYTIRQITLPFLID